MAVLSETDRQRVWRGLMRWWAKGREAVAFSKTELKAAIDATDDWQDGNAAASSTGTGFNSALPVAFRTSATLAQKTLTFCAVAAMRVSVAFARAIFGELD